MKAVREVMSQMLEAWKLIPDLSGEVSAPHQSVSSSKGLDLYSIFYLLLFTGFVA